MSDVRNTPPVTPVITSPNLSLFEASRLFLQTNHSLDYLSKRVRILRRKHLPNGRNPIAKEPELQKTFYLKLRSTSRPASKQSQSEEISPIQNNSLHFDRVHDTRETSRRLQQSVQRARFSEAEQIRQWRLANRQKLLENRRSELQEKRIKRDKIMHFRELVKEHSGEYLSRKLLRTSQEKRSQVDRLLKMCNQKQELIAQLEKEKENLAQLGGEHGKPQRTFTSNQRPFSQGNRSALVAFLRQHNSSTHAD